MCKNICMEINERLKELRAERCLTLKQVAEHLEISLSAYASYEHGTREPSITLIKRMCQFYEVSAGYLLGLED